ncbi:uncharacterized protein ACA1_019020 [Acanthamoeba castellanii str. Neff]|uniref:F-box domain-containing protein n=1 Tax=Acanthamoeba castellanii (strain ATCC 30010 / Neff) TaxID=1257118 RepID=L8HKL3_ACACF|nr:uncharacterized protein ACA1_019020 [Acanthamoeba castellanii str. Neff]ELR25750.1 hypothetical protein ACA1_019020 [Acanthamoeba castellanii str. Neff]
MEVPAEVLAAVFEFLPERELLLGAALVCRPGRRPGSGDRPIYVPASPRAETCEPAEVDWAQSFRLMVHLRKALAANAALLLSEEHKARFVIDELRGRCAKEQEEVLVCDLAGVTAKSAAAAAAGESVKQRFHSAVKEAFRFPDHYGHNLDALNDCLGDLDCDAAHPLVLANITADVVADPDTRWPVVLEILDEVLNLAEKADEPTKLVLWFTPEAARLQAGQQDELPFGTWA